MIAWLGWVARTIGVWAMLGDAIGAVALMATIWALFVLAGCL